MSVKLKLTLILFLQLLTRYQDNNENKIQAH